MDSVFPVQIFICANLENVPKPRKCVENVKVDIILLEMNVNHVCFSNVFFEIPRMVNAVKMEEKHCIPEYLFLAKTT